MKFLVIILSTVAVVLIVFLGSKKQKKLSPFKSRVPEDALKLDQEIGRLAVKIAHLNEDKKALAKVLKERDFCLWNKLDSELDLEIKKARIRLNALKTKRLNNLKN